MSHFNDDQISEYQETFSLFDTRGDGKIAVCQVGEVLRAMGQNPTEAEVRKVTYNKEPENRVSFETFLPILVTISKNKEIPKVGDFLEGFKVFDKDQNGTIHSAELRHLLVNLGEKLLDEEVNELLQGHEDNQGNVNYEEFIKAIITG